MSDNILTRVQFLAAEIFSYSYASYADHLGIGHERFEELMPNAAKELELAVKEDWDIGRVAQTQNVDSDTAAFLLERTKKALKAVDSPNPALAFRETISQLVSKASEEGLDSDESVNELVAQICYRVSDLRFLMKADGSNLESLCAEFRREAD